MPDILTLTCPSCGAKLKVTDQVHLLVCRSCGNEHMVIRNSDSIYLAPMAQDVRQIRVGVDKTAAELAVTRLSKEISDLENQMQIISGRDLDDWVPETSNEHIASNIGIAALVVAVIMVFMGGAGNAIYVFLLALLCLFILLSSKGQRQKKANAMFDEQSARVGELLKAKSAQLAKNQKIVDS